MTDFQEDSPLQKDNLERDSFRRRSNGNQESNNIDQFELDEEQSNVNEQILYIEMPKMQINKRNLGFKIALMLVLVVLLVLVVFRYGFNKRIVPLSLSLKCGQNENLMFCQCNSTVKEVLYDNQCLQSCPEGFMIDEEDFICKRKECNAKGLITYSLISQIANNKSILYQVALPDSYNSTKSIYPVVYLFHGKNGTFNWWNSHFKLQCKATEYQAIFISVNIDMDLLINETFPEIAQGKGVKANSVFEFIFHLELHQFVQQKFRIDKNQIILVGVHTGAQVAALLAFNKYLNCNGLIMHCPIVLNDDYYNQPEFNTVFNNNETEASVFLMKKVRQVLDASQNMHENLYGFGHIHNLDSMYSSSIQEFQQIRSYTGAHFFTIENHQVSHDDQQIINIFNLNAWQNLEQLFNIIRRRSQELIQRRL